MTTQKLFDDSLADEFGTGWKVSFEMQYQPWLMAAGENDPRPVLTGVYFDPAGWMVATNGFAIAVMPARIQPGVLQTEPFTGAIVPAPFIKAAFKSARKHKAEMVELAIVGDRARFDVYGGGSWCDLIEEEYPAWRALIPETVGRSEADAVNPEMASLLTEAIGGGFLRWQGDQGKGGALVMVGMGGESFGLLMPIQVELSPPTSLLRRAAAMPEVRSFAS